MIKEKKTKALNVMLTPTEHKRMLLISGFLGIKISDIVRMCLSFAWKIFENHVDKSVDK